MILSLLVTVLSWGGVAQAWVNSYDNQLNFKCPKEYQAISKVLSHHENKYEDRVWDFTCADIAQDVAGLQTSCFWTSHVNQYDKPFVYTCPSSHYISGMESDHNNHAEDRIWKFYCCSTSGFHLLDCSRTGYTNDWDHDQDYTVGAGKVMKGVDSVHDNHKEDRRWEYEVCKIARLGDETIG